MVKKRPSLEAMMQGSQLLSTSVDVPPAIAEFASHTERASGEGKPHQQEVGRAVRRDRPHTTVYLDPAVRLTIKRIALDYNRKPHDLMIEGIDMMLLKYIGKTTKDFPSS